MTIKELKEKLENFTDDEREKYLSALVNKFSKLSRGTIQNFQQKWEIEGFDKQGKQKPFEEFKKAQNKEFLMCINMEIGFMGKTMRELEGLSEMTLETEL